MRLKRHLIWLLCCCVFSIQLKAQDLHFSQFFHSPLTTNPANTGFLPASDFRIGAHYRTQWTSIPVPYKTISMYGDVQVFRERFETGWIGLGGVILSDAAGSGGLRSNKVYASAAYHQMLGNTGLLSAGFNIGAANKYVTINKFTFDNQWNGRFFESGIPSGENFHTNNIIYFDMQVGLNYAWFPTDDIYMHAGVSAQHINKPKETFFLSSPTYDSRLSPRYIVFADAMIKLNDQWIISPSTYFSSQAEAIEFSIGMHANYNISGDGDQQLLGGLYYRGGDAVIPMIGYQWKQFKFMFSYDATMSPLRNYNSGYGATELYMEYQGFLNQYSGDVKQTLCPTFR
jgi:type IX secretion system PorP/SprF family membrane protein